jgi:L-lactate dehydrogenase complex protein LldG
VEGAAPVSGARTAILARLAAAQRTARLPPVGEPPPAPVPALEPAALLERFRAELEALGVAGHVEGSAEAVRERVTALTAGRRVLSWDPDQLPYGIGAGLSDPVLGRSPRDQQAAAEIGLTGCDAALAETGTLVLLTAAGRSRTVSLLPPVHVAVVKREDLVFGMGQFLASPAGRAAASAVCTFVTGPSRTADIELTLTLGVHGPGQVIVVVGP